MIFRSENEKGMLDLTATFATDGLKSGSSR